jgi:ketosteroid isomerase-like protein
MRRSPDIERLVRETSEAGMRGDSGPMLAATSKEPGVVMIGSDPDEWWDGHDAIVAAMRADVESSGVSGEVDEVVAHEEGDIGWATMRGTFVEGEARVPFRGTAVMRREDGEWRMVQAHASIGVPNDQMLNPALRSQAAHTA